MWLETITIRTSATVRAELARTLPPTLQALSKADADLDVSLYTRLRSVTDLSIYLRHRSGDGTGHASATGVRLAESMRVHGFVNHALWLAQSIQQSPTPLNLPTSRSNP